MAASGGRTVDEAELLRAENARLTQALALAKRDIQVLKAEVASLSLELDKAVHAGFHTSLFDIADGLNIVNRIDERAKESAIDAATKKGGTAEGTRDELAAGGASDTTRADTSEGLERTKERRRFQSRLDIELHKGSVYCARFSPDGNMFATGGFDKNVMLFDVFGLNERKHNLEGHSMMVFHLCWSPDSAYVCSASFDSTCRIWDVTTGASVSEFTSATDGFMLCNRWVPGDHNLFLASHSASSVYWFDKRAAPKPVHEIRHPCMVNTLLMLPNHQLLVGDKQGCITTYDSRITPQSPTQDLSDTPSRQLSLSRISTPEAAALPGQTPTASTPSRQRVLPGMPISAFRAATSKAQISHISTPASAPDEMKGRFISVNAYDNILRIYDRGNIAEMENGAVETPREPKMVCKLMGQDFQNTGYPIQSSFWAGEHVFGRVKPFEERTWNDSLLLATGSCVVTEEDKEKAVCSAHIYDVTDMKRGGDLLQKLTGHTDIVYGVDSHPKFPLLLTYSADGSVRMWTGKGVAP